jgi:hypothetical protein
MSDGSDLWEVRGLPDGLALELSAGKDPALGEVVVVEARGDTRRGRGGSRGDQP